MNREQIYSALFDKVKQIDGLVTVSRVLRRWDIVPPSEQPALFMTQEGELPISRRGMPTTWNLMVSFYLYCNVEADSDAIPAQRINQYLDAIQEALKPDKITGYQTLDGLVEDVRFSEKFETDKGLLAPQSVAIVPIVITITEE